MAAPKFFKDLVLYNINGRNINIPTFVNVKGGHYKYTLKLNELSQLVGFNAIDFNTLERALVQKVNQPKLGFILFFNLEGHSNRVELQITLKHGVKLTDDNKVSAPQTNQGALMSEIETVVQEIQRDKLKSQSGQPTQASQQTTAKWKVGDIVFHKNPILDITELAEIVKVDSNEYTYKTNQYDAKYSKIVSIEYKESVDTFDKNSSEITFDLNDRFSINTGNGYETVIVNSVQGNIVKLVYKNGNRVYAYGNYQLVINDLFKDASVIWLNTKKVKNFPSTSPAPQTTPTFQSGDFILYEINTSDTFVYKVASGLSSNGQYTITYRDYQTGADIAQNIYVADLTQKAKLLSIKNQQRFIVNSLLKQIPANEVVIVELGADDFVISDTNGVFLTSNLTELEVKKYLYGTLAKEVKNLPSTPSAPQADTQQNLADKFKDVDYVYSKVDGKIKKVKITGSNEAEVSYIMSSLRIEEKFNISLNDLDKQYEELSLEDDDRFVYPLIGSPITGDVKRPSFEVVFSETAEGTYQLRRVGDGKLYAIETNKKQIGNDLYTSGAKKVLTNRAKENTPQAFEEQEIETLNKDIAQLMFFKSILSPIDFEKKIEISQEISKKQKRVNDLNFYMLEKRFKSDNIFEDLFEQSFTPINNVYTGVYTPNPEDTDFFTPNGKKSELSDALNVMIRTPQFKAWFGDWELAYLYKDTDAIEIECSKVLTENFEPLVVWHGTGQEFSYFKFDTFPAAYFAVRREYSQFFADLQGDGEGFVIPFFLNIRNPLDLTHFKTNDVSVKDFFDYIFLQTGLDMDDLEVNPIFMDSSLKPLQTWIFIRNNPNMLKKIAQLNIFDGIHFYETNPNIKDKSSPAYETEAYITFNANQSKIADPNRGMILLASMKSFILEKGGAI